MTSFALPEGYTLHHSAPSAEDYLSFRSSAETLTDITASQASASLKGSWHAVHITHSSDPGEAVGMGRIVGDGGWYFSIADIVVLSAHRRKGLADCIVKTLIEVIRDRAPKGGPGPHVMLFAAPGARRLYGRHGFKESMPGNMGMGMWLEKQGLMGNE